MMDKRTGYYRDRHHHDNIALCQFNDTNESWRFFDARWGPHGGCRPGRWMCRDDVGFCIEIEDEEFQKRFEWFEWFGPKGDPRVKVEETSILDPHYLDPVLALREETNRG